MPITLILIVNDDPIEKKTTTTEIESWLLNSENLKCHFKSTKK